MNLLVTTNTGIEAGESFGLIFSIAWISFSILLTIALSIFSAQQKEKTQPTIQMKT